MRSMRMFLVLLVAIVLVSCTSRPAITTRSFDGGLEQTTQTASYEIRVWTGPHVTMMMEFPIMAMVDQGQPVNHHLEVHVFDKGTGEELLDLIPAVEITDQATGATRGLPNVSACLLSNHRETAPHYGDNLYLPNGAYSIAVGVQNETAQFDVTF